MRPEGNASLVGCLKDGVFDPIAHPRPRPCRRTTEKLKHGADRPAGPDRLHGTWRRLALDHQDAPPRPQEEHVEGKRRVLHPHGGVRYRAFEIEEHAVIGRKPLAVHEALGPSLLRGRHLDLEDVGTGGRNEGKWLACLLSLGPGAGEAGRKTEPGEKKKR